MRAAFLLSALLAAAVGAQTLPYERVEALNPPVPDDISMPLSITDSGWSLIQSEASNLTVPARYPTQYLFRSPEGNLTRIPLGFNGYYTSGIGGVISEDGRFAVLGGNLPGFLRVDRQTLERRVYPSPAIGYSPFAWAGNRVYLRGTNNELASLDLNNGLTAYYPAPLSRAAPTHVTSDGRRAIYWGFGFVDIQNLITGNVKTWTPPSEATDFVLDQSGRYIWMMVKPSGENRRLVRRELLEGKEETYPYLAGDRAALAGASDRYAFFSTPEALVADDRNETADVYAFDRTTQKQSLLSTRQSSRWAAGDVSALYLSPNGSHTFFVSGSSNASDLPASPFPQLYARSASSRNTVPALVAPLPAGGDGVDGVLSVNGSAALWLRFWDNEWSLRSVVAGKPVLVIPVASEPKLWDVSDDGALALWSDLSRKELHLQRRDVSVSLDVREGTVIRAFIEPKTGIPVATVERRVKGNSSYALLKFDPLRGTSRQIDNDAPSLSNISVGGGRVAWSTRTGTRVLDLSTNATLDLTPTEGTYASYPRLTSDGKKVGVPEYASDASGFKPLRTRLYRLPDGEALRSTYYGDLSADGDWLTDPVNGELVYAKTGARIPGSLLNNLDIPGTAVGPAMIFRERTSFSGQPYTGDVWRYRVVAAATPITSYFYAVPRAQGWVELTGGFRKAGLENANTWLEYRIDGAGEWTRMKAGVGVSTRVRLSDGSHLIEARAVDAKGRVEPQTNSRVVLVDATPPTVSDVKVVKLDRNGYQFTATTDAVHGGAVVTYPDGTTQGPGYSQVNDGRLTVYYTFSEPGTYTFYLQVFDKVGNFTKSAKKTFKVD